MAELDEKLLKNLDKTLESMNERLLTLETTLSDVKKGINKTFDTSIITSFSDAIRGLKTLRLIDAERETRSVKDIEKEIGKLKDKLSGKVKLNEGESFSSIQDELSRYEALRKNLEKGSEMRAVELANAAKKEADAVEAEERRKQKAFQDSVKQQEELARKYAELERLRSDVFGGRSYGKLSGKEKVQWTEMGSSLEKIKKQMEEIEKLSPGSRAKGESIYKEQEAITRAKRESAEEQKRIAKEEAEYEKLLRQEQIQEERRKAAETKRLAKEEADALSEYIRLYREKTGLLKTVSPLDAKVIRNQPLTEQERGLYDASWNRIYAINDEMAKLRANYVSVLEYEEKIQANGQEQVNTKKVQLAQEQALAKEKERQAKSESKQQSDEAKIQKQADAIVKKRIDLERQVQRIDNDRAIRQQTNSKISQQALDAESRKYEALLQRINQLNNALSKLEGKQSGVTSRAEQRNQPYMNYVAAAEEERKAKAIENSTKKLKEQKRTLDSMLPTLQRLASAFGIAFSVRGLAQFGKKLIETRGEFEMQFVAMKQIIGDVDAATKIWNQTMQQALQSPFKAMQLVTYTKQLAAYRIETEKLFDTTKRLADISAGLGVDMGRLILAYGQVKSANFLRASEIRQFTEAGVNIVGNLSRYFTELEGRAVSTAEVMERVTKRMVSFSDVETIFKRMTDEGGEFFNMQEVQADTVKGQINKLHDAYDQMLNTIGESKQGAIREMVEALNELVRNWRNVVVYLYGTAAAMGVIVAKTKILPWLVKSFKDAGNSVVFFNRNLRKAGITLDDYIVRQRMATRGATGFSKAMHLAGIAGANLEKVLRMIPSTIWWVAAIEGITMLVERLTEARREANRLQKDLSEIKVENSKRASDEIKNYDELIHRMNELNRGSVERRNVIDKINSQYGKYIGFLVTEATTLPELAEAQERVTKNIQEAARARAEEASAQRIQENFIKKEQEIIRGNWFSRLYDQSYLQYKEGSNDLDTALSLSDAAKFAEYYRSKIENLTDEQVEAYANDKEKLLEATTEWLKAFLGIDSSDVQLTSFGFEELADLYIEEEKRLRDARERITLDLGGLTKEQQEAMKSLSSSVSEAITKLSYAGKGEEINIEDLGIKFVAPTDLGEKSGIFEAIKQEINKRKDEFIIDLKLRWGYITEQQAEDAKKAGASTGDIFVDAVNKEIEKEILQSRGISNTYSELLDSILDPSKSGNWDDTTWNNVNEAIDLITRNLITSSDITNGLTNYTKILSENLGNGREAIDEAVKRQNLLVDGTEEEVKRAQEAVDKAKERYKWLLKIAKLLGLDTKSADEIVEEEGYDLSVGQFRLAAAQSAFMEKFGKASNAYGKQLSQIGVTENLKEVADAYHKQSDELDGLIKNQEKALKNETNLTEEQKENAKTTIENLKEQKSMAEFLATFFGYVPKKTTNTTHENASKLISLIKEMRSEYDKLSKSAYGYAKSEEKVRESYKDSVKKILGKAGITDYDFTTNEGMIKALEKVKSYATKLGKDAAAEVQKYIDQLETEIEINAQVKIREDFGKKIEEMFSNYDLTLDLEKLSLPTDELEGIFKFDHTTLNELRKAVDDFYNQQIALGDDPTELVKQVEGYYKKIDEMEKKELRERLKEYSKYLADGQNEALKIHLEELKKMAKLDELYQQGYFTDTQYKDISNKIRKETDEKLAKNDWQQFKESDFYVTMFEDMSRVSSESIDIMIDRLKKLRKSVNDLNPKQAKEIVKALEKLEKAKFERSPLKSFFADWKTANEWRKNADSLESLLREQSQGVDYWGDRQKQQSEVVAGLRTEYEQLVQNGKLQDAAKVKENLDVQEKGLSLINEQLENQKNLLDQTNQKQNEGYAAQQRVLEGLAKGAQYFSDLASTAGTISTEIMDMFDGVSDASKQLSKDIAEIAANVGILAGDIVKAIASEGTDVGSMIDGLVRTWNIIKGIFSASEYQINYTIEKNTDALKDLEFELERVRRARERAWDTHDFTLAQKEIETNIYEQIEAYDALINAEEERKNKDEEQIRTWTQEREELFDLLEDERENLLKEFGGLGESEYKSAAQGFVDAWKSAFLETGDGLQGLQDHFDEFLQDWFAKQATMQGVAKYYQKVFDYINGVVEDGSVPTRQEIENARLLADEAALKSDELMQAYASIFGLGGEGSLSGLAAGIQGMTEEQANILEAYWNSVRGYTASIDMNVARIAEMLGAGGVNTNPQLQQLNLIAANTQATHQLLQSVTKSGHSQGGYGIKVFAD